MEIGRHENIKITGQIRRYFVRGQELGWDNSLLLAKLVLNFSDRECHMVSCRIPKAVFSIF
jgi:hypothetical protein